MTLQQLSYLVTVAECGNITDAAERLFISQPSLSTAIHNLEKEMGVTAFVRSNKGVTVTREGEGASGVRCGSCGAGRPHAGAFRRGKEARNPNSACRASTIPSRSTPLSMSCSSSTPTATALSCAKRRPGEIIDDVAAGRSELGIMYLCESNETVLTKLLRRNELAFEELFTAAPHVFINKDHPLAERACITLEELKPYPYLIFEQGERNSFYFAEELLSMLDMPKTIQVRDRATLFSLVIGLNGFTVSSGIIDRKLNSPSIIARPLEMEGRMRIGLIRRKNVVLSRCAEAYIEALKHHLSIG